jgi:hypothetical protein
VAARVRPIGGLLVGLILASFTAGCGIDVAETPPPSGPLPTPLGSVTPAIGGARIALDAALRAGPGVGLDDAPEGYRPAEPPVLVYVPRAVAKVRLPNDPDRLYVVFYAFPDAADAAEAGRQAAGFFGRGPALVQFPSDTRFALGQVGEVLVFAAWSPSATTDRPSAEAAFEIIQGFGQAIPIGP